MWLDVMLGVVWCDAGCGLVVMLGVVWCEAGCGLV